jgi:hypothetical protein
MPAAIRTNNGTVRRRVTSVSSLAIMRPLSHRVSDFRGKRLTRAPLPAILVICREEFNRFEGWRFLSRPVL